jgi:hypothetical protein
LVLTGIKGKVASEISIRDLNGRTSSRKASAATEQNEMRISWDPIEMWTPRDKDLLPYPKEWVLTLRLNTEDFPTTLALNTQHLLTKREIPKSHIIQSPILFLGFDSLE